MRCCHFSPSLGLLMKAWIWYRCQNKIENYYHHDGEQLGFYKKVHIKTQGKKKDVLVIFKLQETNEFHIAYWTWRKLTLRNCNWTGKLQVTRLYFLKEIVLAHFQRLFGRRNHDVSLENEAKIHEGGCVKEFFSLTCWLVSRKVIIDKLIRR